MKKLMVLLGLLLLPVYFAQADGSEAKGKMALDKDCVAKNGEQLQIQAKDCQPKQKAKADKENRSIHGDNNPGKGHDKNTKKEQRKN